MKRIPLALLTALAPQLLLAHHGINTQFDVTKLVQVEGVITSVGWVNPHSYVYFDVTDASGNVVSWNCEMRAASILSRSGWSEDMFAPGTTIKVAGVASRRDPTGCYVEEVALGAGPVIERYEQIETDRGDFQQNRPTRTAWGDPNIDGHWAAAQRLVGAVSAASLDGTAAAPAAAAPQAGGQNPNAVRVPNGLTEAGSSAYALYMLGQAGVPDGSLNCNPRDFVTDWIFDQHTNRIVQEQDKITLQYGFMDVERTIHMNQAVHPAVVEPTWAGHSIGKWEGDVLVVDTIGFTPAPIIRGVNVVGVRSSQYHVVEQFRIDPATNSLQRSYVVNDPLFFDGEQRGEQVIQLADYPHEAYNCDDRALVE